MIMLISSALRALYYFSKARECWVDGMPKAGHQPNIPEPFLLFLPVLHSVCGAVMEVLMHRLKRRGGRKTRIGGIRL